MKDRKVDTLKKHQKQKKWIFLLKNENLILKISGRIPNGDRNLLSKGISLKSLFGPVMDILLSRTKRWAMRDPICAFQKRKYADDSEVFTPGPYH